MSPTLKQAHTQPTPNLCKDCKYFKPYSSTNHSMRYSLGKCTYEHQIDLVSGRITYEYASIAREYRCKEQFYVKAEKPKSMWEQLTMYLM